MAEAENGLEGRNEGCARYRTNEPTIFYRVNKSCDSCLRAKRKCDHKRPCSRCIGRGDGDLCTYSKRKPHKPHKPHRSVKREGAAALDANCAPSSSRARMVRARFSPSPATGLVGMKENAYLGYFFGGVAFLPLTSQSHIREIIVKVMSRASGLSSMPGFDQPGDGFSSQNSITSSGLEWGFNGMVTGPSACILWSAIALGALAKGVPSEEVDVYLRTARAEVRAFPLLTAEAVGAWTILGYVYGFLGDKEEFSSCLKCADALMNACKESGSKESFPIGLIEIIKWDKSLTMNGMSKEDMQALSKETIVPPEMSSYPSEAEVYRYMVAFNRAIVQVFAQLSLSATEAAQRDGGGSDGFDTTGCHVDESEETMTKMIPIAPDAVWSKFKESSFELDILEQAVTHRLLSTVAAAEYDKQRSFEKSRRVLDAFERYPGLFRFVHWVHVSHYLAAFLAGTEDPEGRTLYEKLRAAYNPVRVSCFPAIPPFEEWRGVSSICDDPACRMCEDYFKGLPNHAPCKQPQDTVQVDDGYAGDATLAELLHGASMPTPEPSQLSPDEGIRFILHGEKAKNQDIDIVSTDGEIEIEMLSTLANAEPAALEEALFSQREGSKLLMPPQSNLGVGTGRGYFNHPDSLYIDSKMSGKVSSPFGYAENHVVDSAAETIDAEDWLETIDAIHSSDQGNSSPSTPVVRNSEQKLFISRLGHGKHESGGGAL